MKRSRPVVLGGEYAISYRDGILLLPLITFGTGISELSVTGKKYFWEWSVASAIGALVAAILLISFDKTFWRNRRITPVDNWQVFAVGFFFGLIKGLVTEVSAQRLLNIPISELVSVAERALISGAIGMVCVPLIALAHFGWNEFVHERRKVFESIESLEELTKDQSNLAGISISSSVKQDIAKAMQVFETTFANPASRKTGKMADALHDIAQKSIRPVSHSLWFGRNRKRFELAIKGNYLLLLPLSIKRSLAWFVGLNLVTSTRVIFGQFDIGFGILTLIIAGGVFYSMLTALSVLINRYQPSILTSFALICFTLLSGSFINYRFIVEFAQQPELINFWYGAIFTQLLFLIAVSVETFLQLGLRDNDLLKSRYSEKYFQLLKSTALQEKASSKIAVLLHGNFQSSLYAAELRMRAKGKMDSSKELEIEYKAILSLFDSISDSLDNPFASTSTDLGTLKDKWREFIDVEVNLNFESNGAPRDSFTKVFDFVSEAIANAYRHGEATKIKVDVSEVADGYRLIIENDGAEYLPSRSGMGFSQFTRITNGNWEIFANDSGGSTVVATIPVQSSN
jgi:hypothetical protein